MSTDKTRKKRSDDVQAEHSLESTLNLEREIERVLVPVEAGSEFKESLRNQLFAVMRDRADLEVLKASENRRRIVILGATLASLVPLCGVTAYLVRSRVAGKLQSATSQ